MKPIYLISKEKGTAVAQYSLLLPESFVTEKTIYDTLLPKLQAGEGLSNFSIIHHNAHGSWVELDDTGVKCIDEETVLNKVVSFCNSAVVLNEDIMAAGGEFNLVTKENKEYLQALGFANLFAGFILAQLGLIDTTLTIGNPLYKQSGERKHEF